MKIMGVKMHGRTDEITDFVEFDLEDVNYMDLWCPTEHSAKVPAYHTTKGSFLALNTIKDLSKGYKKYGFSAFDRSTVVNLKNIKEIVDETNGTKIIFNDNSYVKVRQKVNKKSKKRRVNPT